MSFAPDAKLGVLPDRITLFVAVAEAGSFSEVARRNDCAASTVTRAIDALEAQLSVQLFHRSTRALGLTSAGHAFLDHAQKIAAQLVLARQAVGGQDEALRGTLRISASPGFGRLHVAPAVGRFLVEHPDVRAELILTDAFIDLPKRGVDLALRIGALPDSSLIASKLADIKRALCASPDYVAREGRPQTLRDLEAHHRLCTARGSARTDAWTFKSGALDWRAANARLVTDLPEALVSATLAGAGIAYLPLWLIHQDLAAGRLVRLLPEETVTYETGRSIYAVRPAGASSAKTRAFLEFLRHAIGRPAYWELDAPCDERP